MTTSKLADGAVTTSKIANHTITPNKITGISKLVFAQCTIRIERDSNGGICSVPQAEISDMVFVGASNSHQGSGGLILHAGFVESAGQVRLIARIFDVSKPSGRTNVADNTLSSVVLTCDTIECNEQTTVLKFS